MYSNMHGGGDMDLDPTSVALIVNGAALVWGAARINTTVKRLEHTLDHLDGRVDDHATRISRMEGTLGSDG